jgi:diaminopimelate decarboxylase
MHVSFVVFMGVHPANVTFLSCGVSFPFLFPLLLQHSMTELLRPCLYAAQHPVVVHRAADTVAPGLADYVVVGHCCETGDLVTCRPGASDRIQAVQLPASTAIGDLVSIEGAGAYCASMSAKNYNSYPEAAEVMIDRKGQVRLIRKRQTLEQIVQNEIAWEEEV